jgi:hypothetical protein
MRSGRYVMDEIDDTVYSTDSYECYMMYLRLFYPDTYHNLFHKEPVYYGGYHKSIPADHETFIRALKMEKQAYERGFVPMRKTNGKKMSKTVWVEDPEKAELFLSKIRRDLI